jgi:hypothetical protein
MVYYVAGIAAKFTVTLESMMYEYMLYWGDSSTVVCPKANLIFRYKQLKGEQPLFIAWFGPLCLLLVTVIRVKGKGRVVPVL